MRLVLIATLALLALASPRAQVRGQAPTAPPPAAATIELDARGFQPGEVIRVTVRTTTPQEQVEVRAWGAAIPAWRVDALTWQALAGLDLDVPLGRKTITATVKGQPPISRAVTVVRKAFRTRTLTVNPDFVNPPASAQPRIQREAARLSAFWPQHGTPRRWATGFVAPVPQPANSAFGTRSIYNGQRRGAHGGADFASGTGTPVHAPEAGRVVLAEDLYYTGQTVVVDHGAGLYSLLAHLSAIAVAEGADVAQGDLLGRVGATGRVTGPHLHWTVRLNGARVDPLALIAMSGTARPSPR